MRFASTLAFLTFISSANAQTKGVEMVVPCQQNRMSGKFLTDVRLLPEETTFEVKSYTPRKAGEMWTEGTCRIMLTGPVPR